LREYGRARPGVGGGGRADDKQQHADSIGRCEHICPELGKGSSDGLRPNPTAMGRYTSTGDRGGAAWRREEISLVKVGGPHAEWEGFPIVDDP